MTQNVPTSTDVKQSGSTSLNWLSAFGDQLAGKSGNSLFDSLLGEIDKLAAYVKNTTQTTSQSVKTDQTQNNLTDKAGLQNVVSELSHFVHQWHDAVQTHTAAQDKTPSADQTKDNCAKSADKNNDNAQSQTGTTAPAVSSNATVTAAPVVTQNNTQDTAPATTDATTTDNTAPTGNVDINSLIATMQALLQNVQALQQGASTATQDASLTPTSNGALQDAGAMLLDFLKLVQKAATQLASTTDDATSVATQTTATTTTNESGTASETQTATLDASFLNDLKTLVDQFQSAVTNTQTPATTEQAGKQTVVDALPQNALPVQQNATTKDNVIADNTSATQTVATNLMQATFAGADRLMQVLQKAVAGQDTSAQAAQDTQAAATPSLFTVTTTLNFVDTAFTSRDTTSTGADTNAGGDWLSGQGNNNAAANLTNNDATPVSADGLKSTSTYNFASQLSVARSNSPAALPAAVEQAMVQLSRNIKAGNDQMTLQLRPAELGQINIKLNIGTDGSVTGTVVASHQATLDLLTKDRSGLERALQDAGLKADSGSLQFSLGGQQGQGANSFAQNGNTSSGTTNQNGQTADIATNDSDETENWVVTPGRVNLRV
ncbi:MAG: flagellar hook-length control protein FliK [Alphaproteobacteria bacterium]|nr:flagellar hook-length control protein FliK [Alphaproteobacteria bacterium]